MEILIETLNIVHLFLKIEIHQVGENLKNYSSYASYITQNTNRNRLAKNFARGKGLIKFTGLNLPKSHQQPKYMKKVHFNFGVRLSRRITNLMQLILVETILFETFCL